MKADADQDLADEDEAEQLAALSSFAGSVANSDYEDENHVSEEDIFAAENVEEEGLRDTSGRHNRSLTAGRALPNEMEEHNQADEDWVEYNEAVAHPVKAEPQNAEQLARALGGYATRDLQDVRNDVEPRADVYGAGMCCYCTSRQVRFVLTIVISPQIGSSRRKRCLHDLRLSPTKTVCPFTVMCI